MMNISQNSPAQVRHDPDPDQEPKEQHPVLGSHKIWPEVRVKKEEDCNKKNKT